MAAALIGVAAAAVAIRASSGPAPPTPAPVDMVAAIAAAAEPGDVLFKSDAGGFWGNMARAFSETDGRYGHVGVVARDAAGALCVIHAGGDPVSREGRVRSDSLAGFLAGVEAAALYRARAKARARGAMLAYLEDAAARGAPFDRQFSLKTKDRLYCTELVWRALSAGVERDATPNKSVRAGRVYISLEDLQKSPHLREIAAVSRAAPQPERAAGRP